MLKIKKILILSSISPNSEGKGATFIINRCKVLSQVYDINVLSFNNYPSKIMKKFKYKTSKKRNAIEFENFNWKFIDEKISITKVILKKLCLKSFFLFKYNKLEKYLDNSYDIVQAHFAFPDGYLALMIKKKFKIPYVVTCHGSDIHTLTKNKGIRRYIIKALNEADRVFFVSEYLFEEAKKMGYSGKNSFITTNGINSDVFYRRKNISQLKERYELSKFSKIIGFVGNLEKIKGADRLPNIFTEIFKEEKDIIFIIIGEGSLKDYLVENLKSYEKNVVFTGRLGQLQVAEYMNCMDFLIVPSKNEGLGNVIIEGYSCGTKVIGSNCGGIPEAIIHKKYLVSNTDKMYTEIAKIVLKNDNLELSEYYKEILPKHTWENIMDKEMEIYIQVINERSEL